VWSDRGEKRGIIEYKHERGMQVRDKQNVLNLAQPYHIISIKNTRKRNTTGQLMVFGI
jgi:hypothetical protein